MFLPSPPFVFDYANSHCHHSSRAARLRGRFSAPGDYVLTLAASGSEDRTHSIAVHVEPEPPKDRLDVVYTRRYSIDSPFWNERAKTLTEGDPVYRQLHGLEAWFRSPGNPPPKWKMGVATFLGVFPLAMILNVTLGPVISEWPFVPRNAVFNAFVVALLSWAVMPVVTRLLHGWLQPQSRTKDKIL